MSKSMKKHTGACWPSFNRQPVPDEMFVTLRYAERLDANSTVGAYSYLYSVNDVYDPNVTGTGSQPLSYDQWTAIYNRWVVLGSEIEVIITSRTVSGQLAVAVVPVTAASLVPGTYEANAQMRYSRVASTTGGGPSPRIKCKTTVPDLFGVPLVAVQSDDNFDGAVSSSPNRRAVYSINVETSGASDAFSLAVVVKYKVRFFQPLLSSVSLSSHRPVRLAAGPGAPFARLVDQSSVGSPVPLEPAGPACETVTSGGGSSVRTPEGVSFEARLSRLEEMIKDLVFGLSVYPQV